MIVVAMESERHLAGKNDCIVTGCGALNVISALRYVDRDTPILNLGCAGSNMLPVGTKVKIGKVKLYHPNVEINDEPEYTLDGDVTCFTSNDFVLSTDIQEPCVFDMELAYILAMGFTNVSAEKVVSDNLNIEEYRRGIYGKTKD